MLVDGEVENDILQRNVRDQMSFGLLREFQHFADVRVRAGTVRLLGHAIGVDEHVLSFEIAQGFRLEEVLVVPVMLQRVGQSDEDLLVTVGMQIFDANFDATPRELTIAVTERKTKKRCR